MAGRLFYHDRELFGLEVGQTGLRAMAVDSHRRVVGYGSVDVEPARLEESMLRGKAQYLAERITELVEQKLIGHLPSNRVVLSVPTAHTFTRSMILPISAEANLLEALQLESEQYIPVPASELYIDHEIIQRNKDTIEVLMCAVPRGIVNSLVEASVAAKLEPVLAEPAALSLARVVGASEEGHLPTVIVDIGAALSDIAVLDTSLRVTGGVPVGGHTFTLTLSKKLGVSLERAHELKIHEGLGVGSQQAEITAALKPNLDKITSEMRKVLRYYNERIGAATKIEQVVLVGSGSNVLGLGEYFTEALMLPTRVGNPWHILDFGKLSRPTNAFRPRYVTAVGLALVKPQEVWA